MTPEEILAQGRKFFGTVGAGAAGALSASMLDLPQLALSKIAPSASKRLKEAPGYDVGHTIGAVTGAIGRGPVAGIIGATATDPTVRQFMAGSAQANLMGAPEWIAKKTGQEEAWNKLKGPAYTAGNIAGTIGSAFIPVGGAKGLLQGAGALGKAGKALATGAKGVEAALGATKLGKILPMAAGAALEGGIQGGLRAGFGGENAAKGALEGAALGGIGGAVAGGFAQAMPRIVAGASKAAKKAIVGLTAATGRDMNRVLAMTSGKGSKGLAKLGNADELMDEMTGLIKKHRLDLEGNIETLAARDKAIWKTIGEAGDALSGNANGAEIVDSLLVRGDYEELIKKYGQKYAEDAMNAIKSGMGGTQGAANVRAALWRQIEQGRLKTPDQNLGDAIADIASTVRNRYDDLSIEAFQRSGGRLPDGMDFGQFKSEYRLLEPLASGEARSTVRPWRANMGSKTASAIAVGSATGAMTPGDIQDKLKAGAIGSVGGWLGDKALGKLISRGVASADDILRAAAPLAPKVAELAPRIASTAGKLAASLGSASTDQEAQPGAPAQAPQAAAEGEALAAGDATAYADRVQAEIDRRWTAAGGDTLFPGRKAEFMERIRQMTNNYSPEMTAGFIYSDPAERASFLKALEVNRTLSSQLPTATEGAGPIEGIKRFFGTTPGEIAQGAAKSSILGAIQDAAQKAGNVPAADVKRTINQIMGSPGNAAQKRAMLEDALASWGVDMDLVRKAGLPV